MAAKTQTHIYLRFAWQAWHLWHGVAPLGPILSHVTPRLFAWQAWHLVPSTFISRGRRGANIYPRSFCVAGVALMMLGGALRPGLVARDAAAGCVVTSTFVSRGSYGANSHPRLFCVAGVGLMVLGGALGPGIVARNAAAVCAAGVALGDIHFCFMW